MHTKETLRRDLSRLAIILHPLLPRPAQRIFSALSILAQASGEVEIITTEAKVAQFAGMTRGAAAGGMQRLVELGFVTKDAPRGRGTKFYKLELAAMEAAALRIRLENAEFSRLLEQTGIVPPLPPVRKRKRPVAA